MKCNHCGANFEGKFCTECGTKYEPPQVPNYQQTVPNGSPQPSFNFETQKKKKPFFLRWWFILLVVVAAVVIILSTGNKEETFVWEDMILGHMIPTPESSRGKVYTNDDDELWLVVEELTEDQLADYNNDCESKGFVIEAEKDSYGYTAYNVDGYRLELSYYKGSSQITIRLEAPMEMTTIAWPISEAGNQLPIPQATIGKFTYERADSFFLYLGETPKAEYDVYVQQCMEDGFQVDYDKGEDYYNAENEEGWELFLRYEGNKIMSIQIQAPKEEPSIQPTEVEKETEPTEETIVPETTENKSDNKLDPDFKKAMDSYEEFMDKYVAFMKKYNKNPTDMSLLMDYANYMQDYAEACEDFAAWENEEMNKVELSYYIEVQTRVNKKLLDVLE